MHVLQPPPSEDLRRIEPLSKLPVFWALEKKRVVVVGGSDGAAWKAELLAACGARVEVFAEEVSDGLQTLFLKPPKHPSATLIHHNRVWMRDDLKNAELAIADIEGDAEARHFFDAARSLGVPVNVIDKPAYCQFQFGSIVNRSPVVVAISTDGAAPILAQTIRRKIETLLSSAIQSWAHIARSVRGQVNELLTTAWQRRTYWEKLADLAFSGVPAQDAESELLKIAHGIKDATPTVGSVTLVGAGPGDADLLTLKAVRALQAADVILFDDLVSADVLELARREARRMLVGKRGGRTSCRQEDINEMMIRLAKAGKRVVRLKSGDPMIFGRAGEEIACLRQKNIPVDVIPGITAASAMASRLGVSLTHRDYAQSVRYVTGHSRNGGMISDMDWHSLAEPRTTNVFYMSGRTACQIADNLMAAGLPSATPVIIVSNVSRPNERTWNGKLAEMGEGIDAIGYEEPVLIAVGTALSAYKPISVELELTDNSSPMMAGVR